jgi:hypothetical protein
VRAAEWVLLGPAAVVTATREIKICTHNFMFLDFSDAIVMQTDGRKATGLDAGNSSHSLTGNESPSARKSVEIKAWWNCACKLTAVRHQMASHE